MAKAHAWYERTYGERLNSDWAYGYAPVRLGNALWRVRAGVSYGTVRLFIDRDLQTQGVRLGRRGGAPASANVLLDVDGLPQGLISRRLGLLVPMLDAVVSMFRISMSLGQFRAGFGVPAASFSPWRAHWR